MLLVTGFILILSTGDTIEHDLMIKLGGITLIGLHLLKEKYFATAPNSRV